MVDWSIYGLTEEEAELRGIHLVEATRKTNPDLAKMLEAVFPAFRDRVLEWEAWVSYMAEPEYAKTRGWNDWTAIREFIQNAMDEVQESFGYEKLMDRDYFNMWFDEAGVHIYNRGRPITFRHFLLGRSEKGEFSRGMYGEGMKVAAAYFNLKGRPVYIHSGKAVYKVFSTRGIMYLVMGRASYDAGGTYVFIPNIRRSDIDRYVDLDIGTVFMAESSGIVRPLVCYENRDETGRLLYKECVYESSVLKKPVLWVRDIYVNELDKLSYEKFLFSYNLWDSTIVLTPNRISVESPFSIRDSVSILLYRVAEMAKEGDERANELIDRIVDKMLSMTERVEPSVYHFDTRDIMEIERMIEYGDTAKRYLTKLALELGVPPDRIAVVRTGDVSTIVKLRYWGFKVLTVNENILSYFPSEFKGMNSLAESSKRLEKTEAVPVSEYTLAHWAVVRIASLIAHTLGFKNNIYVGFKPILKEGADGYYSGAEIYYDVTIPERLLDYKTRIDALNTIIHEITHAYGYLVMNIDAGDETKEFEKAFGEVATKLLLNAGYINEDMEAILNGSPEKGLRFIETRYRTIEDDLVRIHKLICVVQGRVVEEPYRYDVNWYRCLINPVVEDRGLMLKYDRMYKLLRDNVDIDSWAEGVAENIMKNLDYSRKHGGKYLDVVVVSPFKSIDMHDPQSKEEIVNAIKEVYNSLVEEFEYAENKDISKFTTEFLGRVLKDKVVIHISV